MKLDTSTLDYVAALARLSLPEAEKARILADMQHILDYFEQLNALDTEGVTPMAHPLALENVLRSDTVAYEMEGQALLVGAPAVKDGCWKAPRTVE